jgi:uncharacterized membrane protein
MTGRMWWSLTLGLAGLSVSAYLVAAHYFADQVPLACSTGGFVDCEQVTSSGESMLGPLPVAVLGLLWFVGFLVLLVAAGRRAMLRLGWTTAGLLFVFWLVYAELFLIGALCLWCTGIHAIAIALFLISLWDATAA